MPDRTFAIIDPFAGASGDMFLGALLSVGLPADWLESLPQRLGLDDVSVRVEAVDRSGVCCTRVAVVSGERTEAPGEGHGRHHGPHRRVGELLERLAGAPLSEGVRATAMEAFRLLGEAEGRVHGVDPSNVLLHEVGAWDALVDIVGTIEGFERLAVEAVYARPVVLGEGWVHAAHGHLPVPAPATALLVEGLEVRDNGPVRGEATTPTGAALLRVLSAGPPPVRWTPLRSGWGAGTRNPEGYPNALRLLVARGAPEPAYVRVLATDLDDMSPEYLEPLREALFEAGALDVQVWVTQMKKGRPGFRVEASVAPGAEQRVADACFAHSTTAGIRWTRAERVTLARDERQVAVGTETVRVKILHGPGGDRIKPEYEDVTRVARDTGRSASAIAAEARAAAEQQETDGPPRPAFAHKESA